MVKLADIVALVESDGNKLAIRFEPAVYERMQFFRSARKENEFYTWYRTFTAKYGFVSQATYKMLLSTSWGLYQIMGFNLRGFTDFHFTEFLLNEELQRQEFIRFVETYIGKINEVEKAVIQALEQGKADAEMLKRFISRYNGARYGSGAYTQYYVRMRQAYLKLKQRT